MDSRPFKIVVTRPNGASTSHAFQQDRVLVGTQQQHCDLAIPDASILGEHLVIARTADNQGLQVFTYSSLRDAHLNGRPLRALRPMRWRSGQTLKIGSTKLRLQEQLTFSERLLRLARISKLAILITLLPAFMLLLIDTANLTLWDFPNVFTLLFSTLFIVHSLFTLTWMMYGWNHETTPEAQRSPRTFETPRWSFTALIPARHEEAVIQDTIRAVMRIDYPEELKEILVLCRQDDARTIAKAREIIDQIDRENVQLIVFNTSPINKPHGLNYGLDHASNEVIGIFDAEDEPHPDLYQIINTVMQRERADAVQSGVQLMNYRSHWFSMLNVLEYFFWFRSGLSFFAKLGNVTPLGGNTVFIKKAVLNAIGGWDETCLTEDADIGVQLALHRAKIHIVYDEQHVTREETPETLGSFIRQRARWNQGFIQILLKGEWAMLPTLRQQIVAAYVLFAPIFQALLIVALPIGLWIALTTKLEVGIALISFTPLYLLFIQFAVHLYGLVEFTRAYKLTFPIWLPVFLFIVYYPYQIVLAFSAFRAFYRMGMNHVNWEKTAHANAHRRFRPEIGAS